MNLHHTRSRGDKFLLRGPKRPTKPDQCPYERLYKRRKYNKPQCAYPGCTGKARNKLTSYCGRRHDNGDQRVFDALCEHFPDVIACEISKYDGPKCQAELFTLKEYMNDIKGECKVTSIEINDTAESVPPPNFSTGECQFEVINEWMDKNVLEDIRLTLELGTSLENWNDVKKIRPPFPFKDEVQELKNAYFPEYTPYRKSVQKYINENQCSTPFSFGVSHIYYPGISRIPYIVFWVHWECFQELRPESWKPVEIENNVHMPWTDKLEFIGPA
jgi:hypothetical protein